MSTTNRENLRQIVRYFYDLQKLRIQSGNRSGPHAEEAQPVLSEENKAFLDSQKMDLQQLEKATLSQIKKYLKRDRIYTEWLSKQRGCGPTLSGVLLAEIDITKAQTPSALWAYAGLHVDTSTGLAVRRKKGVKSNWNNFLKAKVLKVLGECLIKADSDWRKFYDDYKNRKKSMVVPKCTACDGTGKSKIKDSEGSKCKNCNGTGGPAPWGNSDGHRHNAAIRYMVKMFLLELWMQWRKIEELPIVPSYAEAKLGIKHGDHATSIQP